MTFAFEHGGLDRMFVHSNFEVCHARSSFVRKHEDLIEDGLTPQLALAACHSATAGIVEVSYSTHARSDLERSFLDYLFCPRLQ